MGKYDKDAYQGAGEYKPAGFARCINQFGNIYEGTISPQFKMNGWVISFLGRSGRIEMGWYKNNLIHGNWI